MLLWAITPAREPATSLSVMPNVSWLLPINRLIWQMRRPCLLCNNTKCDRNERLIGVRAAYLFVGHELNGRLWGNLDDINAVASPQWLYAAFSDHLGKAPSNTHAVALGWVNLGRPGQGQPVSMCSQWDYYLPLFSLSRKKTSLSKSQQVLFSPSFISWVLCITCMSTLSLSNGAVQVRDTAPAPPPATRCRHHIPVFFSSAVNSSGTNRLSPTSKIWGGSRGFQPGDTNPQWRTV